MNETAARLRRAAEHLRTADLDAAGRARAAAALDELAGKIVQADRQAGRWAAAGLIASLLAVLGLVVAGIWVDWRWLATAAVPAIVAVALGCIVYVTGEGGRG